MAITYTTEYPRAIISPSQGTLTNVIKSVYCICRGEDENGKYETVGADISLNEPIENEFIEFSQLTKETLDGWVKVKPEYLELEEFIQRKITEATTPLIVVELPFN